MFLTAWVGLHATVVLYGVCVYEGLSVRVYEGLRFVSIIKIITKILTLLANTVINTRKIIDQEHLITTLASKFMLRTTFFTPRPAQVAFL